MRRYALDTDILSAMKPRAQALSGVGPLPVIVTDVVWQEFVSNAHRPETQTQDEIFLRAIATEPLEIAPQTREAEVYAKLESRLPQLDPGELSIISLALVSADVVPVLNDRRAIWRALEETRGSVMTFHWFLDVLKVQHGVPAAVVEDLATTFTRKTSASAPLWW